MPVGCRPRDNISGYTCKRHRRAKSKDLAIRRPERQRVRRSEQSYHETQLMSANILSPGDTSLYLGRRQSIATFQSNTGETFTPLITQRWTISIDAQVQATAQAPTCTLQICLASGACGSKRAITGAWSTFIFVTRMTANEAQTAIFITSCSEPARVILRNIATPDRVLSATPTALLGISSSTEPPGTSSTSSTDDPTISSSSSPYISDPATHPTLLPQDPASWRIRAINLCEYNRPILVSGPENPDYMLITESVRSRPGLWQ